MTKQELQFQNRMLDLAKTAYRKEIPVYSHFLERNELNILHNIREFPAGIRYETFGGYEFAERQMAVFMPDAPFLQIKYPFVTVKITPKSFKFAEALTHRDYLGAVMHMGVERAQIGDLIVQENSGCILFASPQIAAFLTENLSRIRHTDVTCRLADDGLPEGFTPHFKELTGSVSSLRLDSILALAFRSSRSRIIDVIKNEEVFVNSRVTRSASYLLKDNDVVSARGYGKFIFDGVLSETKKGRLMIQVRIFN